MRDSVSHSLPAVEATTSGECSWYASSSWLTLPVERERVTRAMVEEETGVLTAQWNAVDTGIGRTLLAAVLDDPATLEPGLFTEIGEIGCVRLKSL